MRMYLSLIALAVAIPVLAQDPPPAVQPQPRYGVAAETTIFPQDSPKRLLASIQKAFDRQRVDYVLAHLTDPSFTGAKINHYYREKYGRDIQEDLGLPEAERDAKLREALKLFVAEVNDHMDAEPKQTMRFFRLLKEGNVEESGTTARVTLKDNATGLTLKQFDGRWYLANEMDGGAARPPADRPQP